MNARIPCILSASLLAIFSAAAVYGQTSPKDFSFFRDSNPYLSFDNAAAMTFLPEGKVSVAEIDFNKDNGACTDTKDSDNSWEAGAKTESYVKISDRIAFHGLLSYDYFRGNNMGGPILLDPPYNFINFYEKLETTTGTKARETYHGIGEMSYTVNDRLSLGVGVDYEVIDCSKYKDPRTLNTWMDLDVTAGAMFKCSGSFSIGAAFRYRNTLEKLECDIYGTTDQTYFTFVDFGACYGITEILAGDEGYLSASSIRPMRNTYLGGTIQAVVGESVKLYNEAGFLKRSGSFGTPGDSNVTFCEAGGFQLSYNGALQIPDADRLQTIGLDASFESLSNNENIYEKSYVQGKNTIVNYYGQNNVLSRKSVAAELSYNFAEGIGNYRPSTEFGISVCGDYLTQRSTRYPFYRDHNVIRTEADAYFTKSLFAGKNVFSIRADAMYHMGFGSAKSDGTFAETTSSAPYSADTYLFRQFEYDTAMRAGAGLSFTYTRLVSEKVAVYAGLRDFFQSLLKEPEHLGGRFHNFAAISVGCNF